MRAVAGLQRGVLGVSTRGVIIPSRFPASRTWGGCDSRERDFFFLSHEVRVKWSALHKAHRGIFYILAQEIVGLFN